MDLILETIKILLAQHRKGKSEYDVTTAKLEGKSGHGRPRDILLNSLASTNICVFDSTHDRRPREAEKTSVTYMDFKKKYNIGLYRV